MTTPDFISTYFPELSEISAAQLLDARTRITSYLAVTHPDLDMTPNSVFGDLVITPFAHLLAAHETAMGRFMSDLDLENVAGGVIYNCDFVRKYLNNFAVIDRDNLQSTGVIRILICVNTDLTIDRRTRYSFGDGNTFTLKLPHPGHFFIKAPTGSVEPYTNGRVMVPVDTNRWAVDIGVVGTMTGTPVLKGDAGLSDMPTTAISAISASIDFTTGLPETSLAVLAEKTRSTFFSATLNTRNGARHFLSKEFPSLTAYSPVINSDTEQLREVISVLGIAEGKSDIYVISNGFANTDQQTITLPLFNPVPSFGNPSRFIAKVTFVNPPCYIDSITSATQPTVGLSGILIAAGTTDSIKAPLAIASYTKYATYYLMIPMPLSGSTPLLTTTIGDGGTQYHSFTIAYRSDPMVPVVADTVESRDVAPIGIDVITRGFVVMHLTSLTISYVKTPGVTMALDTARTEIFNYFKTLAYPKVFSTSRIIDSMYYAGATEVTSIVPAGAVQWSVANKIIPTSFAEDPVEHWDDMMGVALTPPVKTISTLADLTMTYVDANLGESNQTMVVVGKRNVCYLLDLANIIFTEVIE